MHMCLALSERSGEVLRGGGRFGEIFIFKFNFDFNFYTKLRTNSIMQDFSAPQDERYIYIKSLGWGAEGPSRGD